MQPALVFNSKTKIMIRNKIKIALVSFILIITACSKDDTTRQEKNLLIGKWRPTTEVDSDGDTYTYEPACNNIWTFTETNITAEWDDDCNGSVDESYSASYSLKNDRFSFNGADTDGEEYFLKQVTETKLEIEVADVSDIENPYGYIMSFKRIN